MNWLEPTVLLVGYVDLCDGDEPRPSIALLRLRNMHSSDGSGSSVVLLHDLRNPVCDCGGEDGQFENHRYYSTYLPRWELVMIASNKSPETWAVAVAGAGAVDTTAAIRLKVQEPEGEKKLETPIDDG